jgi:hypothetical protein
VLALKCEEYQKARANSAITTNFAIDPISDVRKRYVFHPPSKSPEGPTFS